jgi:2-C-methyl-D-erythritol 2,4-cyclodiphosphate synthase
MEIRVGNGYDIHRLVKKRKLIIGNIHIPYEKGFLAHSDGDVLIHALIDSLFGAANLGDIGTHFPDNDEKYKNINSAVLLENAMKLIEENNWEIVNIDSTIICEKPKLKMYIPEIKNRLSGILKIDPDRLSIKAKTKEKLDAAGKGKAVEVFVVTLIKQKS